MALIWTESVDSIDWQALHALYLAAPLGDKSAETLQTVFGNSLFSCFVFDGERLVGAGRAIGDGADVAYICYVALLPSFQGQGIGKAIVAHLVERVSGHSKVFLYSVPGREGFYEQFGFRVMNTAMAIFPDSEKAFRNGYLASS